MVGVVTTAVELPASLLCVLSLFRRSHHHVESVSADDAATSSGGECLEMDFIWTPSLLSHLNCSLR